jgi:hypothetical protein
MQNRRPGRRPAAERCVRPDHGGRGRASIVWYCATDFFVGIPPGTSWSSTGAGGSVPERKTGIVHRSANQAARPGRAVASPGAGWLLGAEGEK